MAKILILSADTEAVQPLYIELSSRGEKPEVSAAMPDNEQLAQYHMLVLVDLVEPAAQARRWLQQLGSAGKSNLQVILVSLEHGYELRIEAHKQGVSQFFRWPLDWLEVSSFLIGQLSIRQPNLYRALVVDDDIDSARLFCEWLEDAKVATRQVTEPERVLTEIQKFNPDVLVLDLYMPNISGIDLAAILRQDGQLKNLPIVYISVEQRMQKQLYALDQGGDYFLTKPFDPQVLVTIVRARARKYRASRQYDGELRAAIRDLEYQQYALNQHAIVSVADASGNIRYVNDKFCEISGYSREELIGNNHRIVKSDVHDNDFFHELWTTITGGQVWHGEVCNRRKDGSHYWVESTIVPLVDSMGIPYRYISTRTEITRIKTAEASARRSDERFQRSQDFANIGTWDWDIKTGELYWSERIGPLFGYESGELETTYENFIGAIHQDDQQLVLDAVNNCVEHGHKYEVEHRCIWPNGRIRWLLERGDVVRDHIGQPLHMLGVVQDITARKQAEIASREARHMLQLVLNTVPVAVYWKDLSGRYIGANTYFLSMLGYDEIESLVGKKDSELPWPGMQGESFHQVDMDIISGAEYQDYEAEVMTLNQGVRHYIVSKIVLPDSHGETIGVLGALQDISERKQFEDQIVVAKEHAEHANKAKSNFLSGMSHELRTPLNSIIGFAQLMQMSEEISGEVASYASEIQVAGNHLLTLINEVLDLAKIESGKIEIVMESTPIDQLIQECIALSQPLADQRDISLSFDNSTQDLLVLVDNTRFKQIMLNLISNGIKYNKPDGSVTVTLESKDGMATIAVRDTGIGIPAERQAEVFEPFSRLGAERGNIEGTGIGLVITRNLVELMGSSLYIVSTEHEGSELGFSLMVDDS